MKNLKSIIAAALFGIALQSQAQTPTPVYFLNALGGTGDGTTAASVTPSTAPTGSTPLTNYNATAAYHFGFGPGVDGVAGAAITNSDLTRGGNNVLMGTIGPMPSVTNAVTFTLWVQGFNTPNNQKMLYLSKVVPPTTSATGSGNLLNIALNGTGPLQVGVNGGTSVQSGAAVWNGATWVQSTWYFVAVAYTGTAGNGCYVYMGGPNTPTTQQANLTVAQGTPNTAFSYWSSNAISINVGNQAQGARGWPGYIDDVCIFPGALSQPQFEAIRYTQVNPANAAPEAQEPVVSPGTTVYGGSQMTLAEYAGGQNLVYQWQTDGGSGNMPTNIPNATGPTLTTTPASLVSAYNLQYSVVVSNTLGGIAVTSPVTVVTVNPANPPVIVQDTTPASIVAYAGGSANFTASFDGNTPMTNIWQVNTGTTFTNVPGSLTISKNASLTLTNLTVSNTGSYQVAVTNNIGGITSTPVALTVLPAPPAPTALTDPFAYAILTNSPVAFWRLNETSNPSSSLVQAYDSSGHNLNGLYQSSVTVDNPGPQTLTFPGFESNNTCATFPGGANGAITIPSLNLSTNTVTITAWINPNGTAPANSGILFFRNAGDASGLCFESQVDGNGNRELGYNWNNNAATYSFQTGLYPPAGQWSFVALVITPTSATVYLDTFDGTNASLSSAVNVVPNNTSTFSGNTVLIGGDPSGAYRNFSGSIGEVAIFNRALSGAQLTSLFAAAANVGVAPSIQTQPFSVTCYPETVQLSAGGTGAPYPAYQWQAGTGGVFANISDGANFSGTHASILTVSRNLSNSQDYQLVISNAYGSATSSVATVSFTPVPTNGIWAVNFSAIVPNNNAPTTNYQGYGIIGNGTHWNSFGPGGLSASGYADDGMTPTGIRIEVFGNGGNWFSGYPMNNPLLDPYCNYITSVQFTGVPNGTYNLVLYAANGNYRNASDQFTLPDGTSQSLVNAQDKLFVAGDNTALFENVVVTNGTLTVTDTGITGTETDFNGAQLQAVSLDPVPVVMTPILSAGSLTLNWTNYGVLMSATNVNGPWNPVTGVTSPYVVGTTNPAQFYRVLVN